MNRRNSIKISAGALAGLMLACKTNASAATNETMDSFWDVVKNRRSVRKFKPDPVPDEHINQILDAARMAPTSGNQQPWKFLVIKEKEQIEALKEEKLKAYEEYFKEKKNLKGSELTDELEKAKLRLESGYLSAPVYIVVLTDNQSKYPSYNHWDGPLAAGYLMLAARALGYGTVFITDSFSEEETQKAFNIPERYSRVTFTPLGVPEEWPTKEKKDLGNFIITKF